MANKFGNKMAPSDPDLSPVLRSYSTADMPGSPKGGSVGPLGNSAPPPPVARKGSKTQPASVTGRG